jgi:hypothetical protein
MKNQSTSELKLNNTAMLTKHKCSLNYLVRNKIILLLVRELNEARG